MLTLDKEKSQISNLNSYPKYLETAKQTTPETSTKKEIIRTKIHEIENRKTIKEIMKPKHCSLTNFWNTDHSLVPRKKKENKSPVSGVKQRTSLQMLQT